MEFDEAMLYVIEKGLKFMALFYRFALNVRTSRRVAKECLEAMQVIWKEITAFEIIDEEGFVGIITNVQLVGWFFTGGLNPMDFAKMPDEDIGYDYDRFLLNLLCDRAYGSYPSVENAAHFMMA